MDRETKLHLLAGLIVALSLAGLIALASVTHPALAIAVAGPLFAWGVERYQAIRRQGEATKADMLATAAPFELVALATWLLL